MSKYNKDKTTGVKLDKQWERLWEVELMLRQYEDKNRVVKQYNSLIPENLFPFLK